MSKIDHKCKKINWKWKGTLQSFKRVNVVKLRPLTKHSHKVRKGLICLGVLGIPLAFIAAFSYRPTGAIINFEGSSAVKPLVDAFSEKYLQIHPNTDIFVQAGGSGTGLNRVLTNQTNFGNYSDFTEDRATSMQYKDVWAKLEIKTITLAWDAIGLLYKRPLHCTGNLVISSNNASKLYGIFSGFKLQANQTYLLSDLMTNPSSGCQVTPRAYARSGGASKSGTAEAFYRANKNLDVKKFSTDHPKQTNALKMGEYGNEIKVVETAESNAAAWAAIRSDNFDGSLIYLSIGFIINNWQKIHQSGFELAGYLNNQKAIHLTPNNYQELVPGQYQWFRPLNTLVSLPKVTAVGKTFINWALDPKQNEIIKRLGFIPLTSDELQSMNYSSNDQNAMWTSQSSDVKLSHYGAKPD